MMASMKHRPLLAAAALVAALITLSAQTRRANTTATTSAAARKPFTVVEATIPEMRAAMEQGHVTSHEIVRQYLVRIGTYEDRLHAAITVNRDRTAHVNFPL